MALLPLNSALSTLVNLFIACTQTSGHSIDSQLSTWPLINAHNSKTTVDKTCSRHWIFQNSNANISKTIDNATAPVLSLVFNLMIHKCSTFDQALMG